MRCPLHLLPFVLLPALTACLDADDHDDLASSSTTDELALDMPRHGRLTAGASHACAVTRNGGVQCWGAGTDGQLGDGASVDRAAPVAALLPARAVAIDANTWNTCAVLEDGRVACWGRGERGQLGTTTSSATPLIVAGVSGAIDVSVGTYHACALLGNGRVSCWGGNDRGELGDGTTTASATPHTVITASGLPLGGIVALHTSPRGTCGHDSDRRTWCWGDNRYNISYSGVPLEFYPYAFQTVIPTSDRVARGPTYYCTAFSANVSCTGSFSFFSSSVGSVPQLETRDYAVCWTTATGSVGCAGDNQRGQRGVGHKNSINGATTVPLLGTSVEVSVGSQFACALSVDGAVRCWGRGDRGQIGDGSTSTADRTSPVRVSGGPAAGAWDIATGAYAASTHACALRGDGTARCVGDGSQGALGNGTLSTSLVPTDVFGLGGVIGLTARTRHACALGAAGGVWCWGQNDRGQVGDGSYTQRTTPSAVRDLTTAVDVAAGNSHTCAARNDGRVLCWGLNTSYELGFYSGSVAAYPVPRLLQVPTDVVSVEAGTNHSCGIQRSGVLYCWGRNTYGETGAGVADAKHLPAAIAGLDDVVDVALGFNHTCALLDDGTVRCWGRNLWGQLGDGTSTNRLTPVTPAVDRVVALTAGGNSTCALRDDGTVRCWGQNGQGQLGTGDRLNRSEPTAVVGGDRFVAVATAMELTCGVRADATTACWGRLGNGGVFSQSNVPVTVDGL